MEMWIDRMVLSAYFLGGYGEDGLGAIGLSKAVSAAAKSWGLGILTRILGVWEYLQEFLCSHHWYEDGNTQHLP
ncbi:hypothetical protein CRYUN_Cryun28dG0069500 [Craigia yunnanensis]